jgi:hypothetical protein
MPRKRAVFVLVDASPFQIEVLYHGSSMGLVIAGFAPSADEG